MIVLWLPHCTPFEQPHPRARQLISLLQTPKHCMTCFYIPINLWLLNLLHLSDDSLFTPSMFWLPHSTPLPPDWLIWNFGCPEFPYPYKQVIHPHKASVQIRHCLLMTTRWIETSTRTTRPHSMLHLNPYSFSIIDLWYILSPHKESLNKASSLDNRRTTRI